MKTELENRIDLYAKLLIEFGLNVQKGQMVVISSPVECAPFARMCASRAYDAGCREVVMNWSDDYLAREKYLRAENDVFDTVHPWTADFYNMLSEKGAAWLSIHASDPEALSGVDPDRLRRVSVAQGEALKPFRDRQMVNFFPWCVASIPTKAWAKKVFPDLTEDAAVERLWNTILDTVRVYPGGDPVAEWKAHTDRVRERVEILNHYHFRSLHYTNALGTDLTVRLPENHIWEGALDKAKSGVQFCANMPTEEVFTSPLKDGADGVVVASKPLVVNGNIVDKFRFTVEKGKIVKAEAEKGLEFLEAAISVDEGAAYFGEVALVPYDSPISNSGILFYNTLFDENASCHIAFGDSYPCIEGGSDMTPEELKDAGLNSSITHDDFMVGTKDLSIVGITKDGEEVPVFIDGNFAF